MTDEDVQCGLCLETGHYADDCPGALPRFIDKADFLREFGKYMLFNLKREQTTARESAVSLEGMAKKALARGDVGTALSANEGAKEMRAREDAFNSAIAMLRTSTRGLDIDPDELEI